MERRNVQSAAWIQFESIFPCVCRWLTNMQQDPMASMSDLETTLSSDARNCTIRAWGMKEREKIPRTFSGVWSHIIWKREAGLGPDSLPWLHTWHKIHLWGWWIDWLLDIYWAPMVGLVLNIHEYIHTFPNQNYDASRCSPKYFIKCFLPAVNPISFQDVYIHTK